MYTDGLQIGDNSYLLKDDDNLMLVTTTGTTEEMEEYLQIDNNYEKSLNKRNELQKELSKIHYLDKVSKQLNIFEVGLSIVFVVIGIISNSIDTLFIMPAACIVITSLVKLSTCGTKKERNQKKEQITKKTDEIQKELKENKKKRDILKEKIEYSEMVLKEDEIIPVTTVENKKANVKMRVLKLEQSR